MSKFLAKLADHIAREEEERRRSNACINDMRNELLESVKEDDPELYFDFKEVYNEIPDIYNVWSKELQHEMTCLRCKKYKQGICGTPTCPLNGANYA